MTLFSENDIKKAKIRGITENSLNEQWKRLKNGFPFIKLEKAATIGDGIQKFSNDEITRLKNLFDIQSEDYDILKFVPASGAATRMFQPVRGLYVTPLSVDAEKVLDEIENFPFYPMLEKLMDSKGITIHQLKNNPKLLADLILNADGLGYNNAPKGLVPFDMIDGKPTTAFEEQISESDELSNGEVQFTVSELAINDVTNLLGKKENISYSFQDPSTDYIAKDGEIPLRDENGDLVFRPSGHGALLINLDELNDDIVFIKNIDNILPPDKNIAPIELKKMLGGLLIEFKRQIDTFLLQLELDPNADLIEMSAWIKTKLNPDFKASDKAAISNQLNRPLRIAGMVKNEGKAGGGPFWVKDKNGISLQIVEGAQIDMTDKEQVDILNSSTHFNPVDLVCAIKDYKGQKFNLKGFIDRETGFDSKKNVDGKEVTIIERPGLWNGAMSGWNTIFVEVPVSTFNPVKSVNDLLVR
jgi:hypothetical protein